MFRRPACSGGDDQPCAQGVQLIELISSFLPSSLLLLSDAGMTHSSRLQALSVKPKALGVEQMSAADTELMLPW